MRYAYAVAVAVGLCVCVPMPTGVESISLGGDVPGLPRGVVWDRNLNSLAPADMLDGMMDAMIPTTDTNTNTNTPHNRRKKRQATTVGYKAMIQQQYSGWLSTASTPGFAFSPQQFNTMLNAQLAGTYASLQNQSQNPLYKVDSVLTTLMNSSVGGSFRLPEYESKVGNAFPSLLDKYSPCLCSRASQDSASVSDSPIIYNVSAFSADDVRTILGLFSPSFNVTSLTSDRLQAEAATYLPRCSEAPALLADASSCGSPRSSAVRAAESAAWLARANKACTLNDYDAALTGFAAAVWFNPAATSNITDLVQSALFANVRFSLALSQLRNKNLAPSTSLALRVLASKNLLEWANSSDVDAALRTDLLTFSRGLHRDARVFAYANGLPLPANLTLPVSAAAVDQLTSQLLKATASLNVTALKLGLQADEEVVRTALLRLFDSPPEKTQNAANLRDLLLAYFKLRFGDIKPELDAAYSLFSAVLWRGTFLFMQLPTFVSDLITGAYNSTRSLAAYNSVLPTLSVWQAAATAVPLTVAQLPNTNVILSTVTYARGSQLQQREDAIRQKVLVTKAWKAKDAVFEHYDMLESAATYEELAFALLDAANWCVYGLNFENLTKAEKYAHAQMTFSSLQTLWRIINIYEVPTRYHIAYWAYRFAYLAGQFGGSANDSVSCATYFNMTNEYAPAVAKLVPPKVCIAEAVPVRLIWSYYYGSLLDSLPNVTFGLRQVTNVSLYYQRMVDKVLHNQDFLADRALAMKYLLDERSDSIENVERALNSSLVSFADGWFKPAAKLAGPLASGGLASLRGISIDLDSGAFSVLVDQADSKVAGLFTWDDVSVAFRQDPLTSTDPLLFSLDGPAEKPWYYYHPFQVFRFTPLSIQRSAVLDTLFRTDYILKQLTSGVEINSKSPFRYRNVSSDGLYSGMSAAVRNAVRPLMNRTNAGWNSRIWLQADDMQYTATQTAQQITYIFGDVKMSVRTNPLVYTATGTSQDSSASVINDVVAQFATDFQTNFAEISKVLPEFARLKELTKIFALRDVLRSYVSTLDSQIALSGSSSAGQTWRNRKANFLSYLASSVSKASGGTSSWTQTANTWVPAAFNVQQQSYVYGGLYLNPGYTKNTNLQMPSSSKYSVLNNLLSPSAAYPTSKPPSFSFPTTTYNSWNDFSGGAAAPYKYTGTGGAPAASGSDPTYASRFSADTVDKIARVVFGEARGEPAVGKAAVLNSILNRLEDPKPSKFQISGTNDDQRMQSALRPSQYETLANDKHSSAYAAAKQQNSADYQNVLTVVNQVLNSTPQQRAQDDPTREGGRPGATNFDTSKGSSGIRSTPYYESNNDPIKIGNHYFDFYSKEKPPKSKASPK